MKKLALSAMAIFLGFSLGCGSGADIDTSTTDAPQTSEEVTQDIEKEMAEKGMSDADYGK